MSLSVKSTRSPLIGGLVSALVVAGGGFLLLNLTFLLDFAFHSIVIGLIRQFSSAEPEMDWPWLPPVLHGLFVMLIGLISWPVLRSRLGVLAKATFLTVPFAVVFVTLGMFLYHWPALVYGLGGAFAAGVLAYLYRTRQPWLYAYALVLVGLALLIGSLLGMEI
jgi:hypothetical protein